MRGRGLTISIAAIGLIESSACRVETEISPVLTEGGSTTTTGGATGGATGSTGSGSGDTSDGSDGDSGSTGAEVEPLWAPGVVYPSTREVDERGFVDLRGLVHTHSPFSHDACDGEPRDENGDLDGQCVEDWRRDVCLVEHDFIFLTDHRDSFSDSEFPDVLHYDEARGDVLVDRGGPVANWVGCVGYDETVAPTLVMAGCEAALMPVGLEGHAPGRGDTYGDPSAASIAELTASGAHTFVAHTEDFTPEQLLDLPLTGFEMYNLHANLLLNIAPALQLLALLDTPEQLPHPDLIVLPLLTEDPRYLETWGTVLARGGRPVTTMGTDAHRNTFPEQLPDGERVDSFRRMMQWFSNHLQVVPAADGTWDDQHVKAALGAGRLYGAFEFMGYPEGFDTWVEAGDQVVEMGGEVSLADAPQIVVSRPHVKNLDPDVAAPVVTMRVLVAREGGFDEVATGDGPRLEFSPTAAGAYRVEVRIVARHLAGYLGAYEDLTEQSQPWVYANPFYVGE